MSLFKLLIHGQFADIENISTPSRLSFGDGDIEGFYASRVVEAATATAAAEWAKEAIRNELSGNLLKENLRFVANLEVEECSLVQEYEEVGSLTGFTFY